MHWAFLAGAVLLSEPSDTQPAPPTAETPAVQPVVHAIEVHPGASCLEGDRVASKVISWLGKPEVDTRIEVSVVGDDTDPNVVRFEVRKQGIVAAERDWDFPVSTSCDEKHAVVSVAVALAIDATLVEDGDPGPPVDPILEPQPASPSPPGGRRRKPEPEEDPEPTKPSDWGVRLGFGIGPQFQSPPEIGGYGSLFAEFGYKDALDLSIGAVYSGSGPQDAGAGRASLSAAGGHGLICGGYRWGRVRPRGCAGLVLGVGFATGQGFEDDRTSRVPWLALTLGGDLRIQVARRIEIELGADLIIHAVRPAFDFLDPSGQRTKGREFPVAGGMAGFGMIFSLR